jgi:hypothetical protein
MRLPKELEDGTTQYQGEIERFLEQVGFHHRLEALFRSDYLSAFALERIVQAIKIKTAAKKDD